MNLNTTLPIYNLNVVLRETGLSADVLRAWEKRYGLPAPQRTAGGHRLYSDYDIQVIKWLQAKLKEGFSISLAVKLWNRLQDDDHPLKGNILRQLPESETINNESSQIDYYRNSWLNACLEFNTIGGENIINQAFSLFPVEIVAQKVLQQGLAEIGQLWFENKITTQQEHFTSVQAERKLNLLISGLPAPVRNETILIGCPAGETHTFPLLLTTLMLQRKGFNVLYLGANIPAEQLQETLSHLKIQLVILAAQRLVNAASLAQSAQKIQTFGIPVGFGGMIFNQLPGLASRIPGMFLGKDLSTVPEIIEKLLISHPQTNNIRVPTDEFTRLSTQLKIKQSLLENGLSQYLVDAGQKFVYVHEVNTRLLETIQAALMFGDLNFMHVDLMWAESFSKNHGFSEKQFINYLKAAVGIIRQGTGIKDNAASAWLSEYIDSRSKQ